jgi:SAM-dependent methyltransferase
VKLYDELADWFHLLTAPEDYADEARFSRELLLEAAAPPVRTLLELGSGGGNNASHLKAAFEITLVDVSPAMLDVSRRLNPECEHIVGDMRDVRLGREFDAVFVHDAVMYMTTADDLARAVETAFVHTRPGGAALFVPDCVLETFKPETRHGGHDGPDGRGLRYVEWVREPDEPDTTYLVDFACLLRERDGSIHVEHDRHEFGIFPQARWTELLDGAGFEARVVRDPDERDVFVARRPSTEAAPSGRPSVSSSHA